MDLINEMNNLVASIDVKEYEGQPVVSSREVANNFGKKHKHVLESIENIKAENSAVTKMFIESSYKAGTGKNYKEYLLTRDGFSLLVMGFTGAKALEWKLKYIEAFNKMEQYIKQQVPQLTEEDQAILSIVNSTSKAETALAIKNYKEVVEKPLIDTIEKQSDVIEKMKPAVVVKETLETSKDSILVGELSKILRQKGIDTGQNRLFEWMRNNGYLIKRKGSDYNMPTQKSMNLGLFEIKETNIVHSTGDVRTKKTTKITGKGQVYFINKFIKPKEVI